MSRVNQSFKDRTELFDDYYLCIKNECNLFHVHNLVQFFVSMYNDKIFENYFINELNDRCEYILTLQSPFKNEYFNYFFYYCNIFYLFGKVLFSFSYHMFCNSESQSRYH